MSSEGLGKVLSQLTARPHPDLLAGTAGFEDAGVFRLDAERALVVTTDFFPPIVDDPRWFGRIAAANALSDVFAMGGEALTALNLVGWPSALDIDLLGEVLAGGLEKIEEAGAALAGGHSVQDQEIKYGLAVTGIVHPDRFWSNAGARAGDVLILTKPLGMGTVSTALKRGLVGAHDALALRAMEQMATLNLAASRSLREAAIDVHAATDVTGFGLVGHVAEMAEGAGLGVEIGVDALPYFDGAIELARQGAVSGGGKRARVQRAAQVDVDAAVEDAAAAILFDAETSGGLLVAVAAHDAEPALDALRAGGVAAAAAIGRFSARGRRAVVIRVGL
ncbi:MAG: selenide, water dikinase SelD [Planctomycetota bacterium]